MSMNKSVKRGMSGNLPMLMEAMRVWGADYRERSIRYNQRPRCPPLSPDGSESPEEAAWTATWHVEQEALTYHPLSRLCDAIGVVTGIDENDLKEAAMRLDSGWRLKPYPPPRRDLSSIPPKLMALPAEWVDHLVQHLVTDFADHGAVAKLQMDSPQLVRRVKTSGLVRRIGSWFPSRIVVPLIVTVIGGVLLVLVLRWLGLG